MNNEIVVLETDIPDINLDSPNSIYTKEQKLEAVNLYLQVGTIADVSRILNIPNSTIINWKERGSWWNDIVQRYRQDKQIELDTKLTNSIHTVINEIADRLDNGDEKPNKYGELQRIPVSARDLSVILNTLYEKRALIRGEATSIKSESKATLASLEDKFKAFALQLKEKDVVSEQGSTE